MEKTKTTNKTKKQSPNLLSSDLFKQNPIIEKTHMDISLVTKILVITTQIIYILLLGYNTFLLKNIKSLEDEVRNYKTEIQNNSEVASKIESVIKKTEELKTLEQKRNEMSFNFENIYNLLSSKTTLLSSALEENHINMTVQTNSALDISILMANYFNENIAEKIILKSAKLNTTNNTFVTEMEIHFK